jgi:aryl-alcohol dehydrogenase-like predicted oxidoreductase
MKNRPYGTTGKFVSEVGFGAWQLGNKGDWGDMNDEGAIRLVQEAIDRGVNFFDTAPGYGFGKSEELLGKALKGKREQVIINTKFGHDSKGQQDFSSARIREAVEDSLRRLQTDYIDSILLHNPSFDLLNGRQSHYDIFEELKTEGKILAYGASVDSSEEMFELINNTNAEIVEVMFNIFYQGPAEAFKRAKEKNIGIIIKVPLDSGWLSGKYNLNSKFQGIRSRWTLETIRQRSELLEKISFITDDNTTMVQSALRFILAHSEVSTVIPGVKNLEQLKENVSATDTTMSEENLKRLKELWEREIKYSKVMW